jgi:hypothetical protein
MKVYSRTTDMYSKCAYAYKEISAFFFLFCFLVFVRLVKQTHRCRVMETNKQQPRVTLTSHSQDERSWLLLISISVSAIGDFDDEAHIKYF